MHGLFALGAVCTHDLAAFHRHEASLLSLSFSGVDCFIPAGTFIARIFDFQDDLYLSAPGLLVLCSGGAVILYFLTDYNLQSRITLEGVEYFTAVGPLIDLIFPDYLRFYFRIYILPSSLNRTFN